jgi:ferredoxin
MRRYIFLSSLFGIFWGITLAGDLPKMVSEKPDTELKAVLSGELTDDEDEFKPFSEGSDTGKADEFEVYEDAASTVSETCTGKCSQKDKNLSWVLGILATSLAIGFFIKYQKFRNARGIFLIATVAILGFWKGACPCPISSFQNLVLAGFGNDIQWQSLVWFLGLIPVTYLAGRVYCGWLCHLGAFQELLYIPGKIRVLQGEKAQKILRGVRIGFLIALIIQLFITNTNIFKHFDPFKAAYNLMASNTLSWILLGMLLISSVFIFRPFCKAVCPIGLILGWINKIPGARVIGNNGKCTGCKNCDSACQIRAITRDEQFSKLDNQECIACGNCIGNCRKGALSFFRNNKTSHHDQISCQNIINL